MAASREFQRLLEKNLKRDKKLLDALDAYDRSDKSFVNSSLKDEATGTQKT